MDGLERKAGEDGFLLSDVVEGVVDLYCWGLVGTRCGGALSVLYIGVVWTFLVK